MDLNGDGDDEVLVSIRCAGAESIYLFGQGQDGFVPLDVPFANDGAYDVESVDFSGRTLTLTLRQVSAGKSATYLMKWDGNRFDKHVGIFRH